MHVSNNIKAQEIDSFSHVDIPLHEVSGLKLRKKFMDIKVEDGERFSTTIKINQKNVMEIWAKKQHKKHASVVTSNLLAWSCKFHGDAFLSSFTVEDQRKALETKLKGDILLHPEEIETQEIIDYSDMLLLVKRCHSLYIRIICCQCQQ